MNKSTLISVPIQVTSKTSPQWRSVVNGKNEKTEWKAWKMNMLAKSKTWKGGLGKNEHPDGLTTSKRRSRQKQGQPKELFPGGSKTRKGDPGKNGMMKIKMKRNRKQHARALTTDAMSEVFMWLFQRVAVPCRLSFSNNFAVLYHQQWSWCVPTTASPEEDPYEHALEREPLRAQYSNVRSIARKIMCTGCQPSCISKHSYVHNHAFYMLMHLKKLMYYSYMLHFQSLCPFPSGSIMSISNFYC